MAPLAEEDPNKRDVAYLDQYAQERWDTVLHYMVRSSKHSGVSYDAYQILLHSGLMTADPQDPTEHNITKSGFQFLLMETSSQVNVVIFFIGVAIWRKIFVFLALFFFALPFNIKYIDCLSFCFI